MGEFNPTMLDPDDDDFDFRSVESPRRDTDESVDDTPEPILSEAPNAGSLLKGVVEETTDTHAVVRLPDGSLGQLPFQELREGSVVAGDEKLVKVLDDDAESITLSEREAVSDYAWKKVRRARRRETLLEGRVEKTINGGYLVNLFDSLMAFMPRSHVDLEPPDDEAFLDRTVEVRVIECDRSEDNVVVSRRAHLEERRERARREFFGAHEVGDQVTGTVKNVVEFGAFVDLGPVDGLLHQSDLDWGPVHDVEAHVSEGEEIEVEILEIHREENRLSLGRKQLTSDPWEDVASSVEAGDVRTGEIVEVRDSGDQRGIILEFEPGLRALIPVDEIAWSRAWKNPSDRFSPGDTMDVRITALDPDERTIRASRKRTRDNPWPVLRDRFPEGTVLSAPVVEVHEDYLTVRLLKNVEGIIRRENVSWEDDVNPVERFSPEEKVTGEILRLDADRQVVELGLKQTEPDPWVQRVREFEEGDLVKGTVTGLQPYGAFVRLDEDLEGLVHVSEMGDGDRVDPQDDLEEGEEVGVKVLSIDEEEHQIDLSMQAYRQARQRQRVEEYMEEESSEDSDVTMGDLLGEDLEDFMED